MIAYGFADLKAQRGAFTGEEPLELCEVCGSPIEGGSCTGCAPGLKDGTSPEGAAPLDRRELSRVLGRSVGARAHGSYALSIQQKEGMAPLRRGIDSLVEQFNSSAEVKNAAKQTAEKLAVSILEDLGPKKAAIASVAQVFIDHGRNLAEVRAAIGKVHPDIDRVRDLVVEVYSTQEAEIGVLVGRRERHFKSYSKGLYR